MFKRLNRRKRQYWGYLFAGIVSLVVFVIIQLPDNAWLHAAGPMNSGHEELACEQCHQPAQGELRQQLQANARYLVGKRSEFVSVGYRTVGNRECLACHQRPSDKHPVARFLEPRFQKARAAVAPHLCVSCHREHMGRRVTVKSDYCSHCHQKLELKKELISVSHERLVEQKRWRTCLGCHDFHGNHVMRLETDVDAVINEIEIRKYFEGGLDPYSEKKKYKARKEVRHDKT